MGAKIHQNDCPTRAFIASGWRPDARSVVTEDFFSGPTNRPRAPQNASASPDQIRAKPFT